MLGRDFRLLWAGQSVSQVGSQVTQLALPLTAALVLGASPLEMGILGAAEFAPFLLVGLFAGVWVDRLPRRPILIGADVGRALLLAALPIAALFGLLRIEQLYVVGFLVGVLTVFFDVAYQSYLPALVRREQLVEGNSRLEISRSVAQIAGPGLAGVLVQALTAPVAIALDALSFLLSALFLGLIRTAEPATPAAARRNVWSEIGEGVRYVVGHPLLRPIAACTATSNLFGNAAQTVMVLYLTRELALTPAMLGLVFAGFGPGALVAVLLATRAADRFGVGPTIVGGIVVGSVGFLLYPLAAGPPIVTVPILVLGSFLGGLGAVYNITQVSLRQRITPDHLQGRMNASMRFIVWGVIPIGSLIGGVLGERIGLRATMAVGAIGALSSFAWVFFSPVASLREAPTPAAA